MAQGKRSEVPKDPTIPIFAQPISARIPTPTLSDHSMEESESLVDTAPNLFDDVL